MHNLMIRARKVLFESSLLEARGLEMYREVRQRGYVGWQLA